MVSSLAAMLQVSLRRSRASWPIVAAAGLICLLASTLLAAGPMYAGAVSIAGLQRVLADAPVAEANVAVAFRTDPAAWDGADAVVRRELDRAIGAVDHEPAPIRRPERGRHRAHRLIVDMADRVVELRDGRLVDGSADELESEDVAAG